MPFNDLEVARPFDDYESEEAKEGRLVFPLNVQESLASSGGLKNGEKKGLIISFWIFACALLGWFLASWLRAIVPRYYFWIVLAVEVVLQLTVGILLARIIFDEGTLLAEAEKRDSSFAKFFGIYHERLAQDGGPYPFDVIEFSDGSFGVYIQLLLGYNTNQASAMTYEVNHHIQQLINKSGMVHKVIFSNERFSNSAAADELRRVVSNIKDPKLFNAYRDIVHGLLQIANEESNVLCTTYIIYAKTRIQKDELEQLVINILNTVTSEETAYREATTMSYKDIVEFYRTYYKLDVLDMGLIRVHSAQKKGVSCPVKVLKVYGKSGKTYTTGEYQKLQDTILSESGLIQANTKKVKSGNGETKKVIQ